MTSSPTQAGLPSASIATGQASGRSVRFGGEAVGAGALVELADQVAGGGEHDRVQAVPRSVCQAAKTSSVMVARSPTWTRSLVEVEPERLGPAVAQGQGGGAFGGVGEPEQLGQPERAVGGGDVAQDAAGADRGELLVVADQPDAAAAADDVARRRRPGRGCRPSRPRRSPPGSTARCCGAQSGRSCWLADQVSLARVSVWASIWSRSSAAAAADGASPITVPPPSVQAAARARMAVVLPAPAGAIASCSRAPEVAIGGPARPGRRSG